MEIKASSKMTMRTLDSELNNSKFLDLLQEAYNMIESLVEHVEILEKLIEDKEDEISELKQELDEANNE